jgi:N-acyl-D-aspartate/D-glutamate deacylase
MDPETNFDAIRNVGVKDGRISRITEESISGKETIDATGHVVAPGFIDSHWHWPRPVGYKLGLRDGLTTAMDLEWGCYGPNVGKWYDMHEGRSQMNYGTGSSHEAARGVILDKIENTDSILDVCTAVAIRSRTEWANGVVDEATGNQLLKTIDEGLQQGALGVSATMGYWPGATAREVFEVHKLAGRYGRLYAIHSRNTPSNATLEANGAQEMFANAAALDAPVVMNHFNNPGWELVQELLVRMREQGHLVWGEVYPYAAGSTSINAAFIGPDNWVKKLGNKYEDTLQDPITQKFYTTETYKEELAKNPTKEILLYKAQPEDIPSWMALPGVVLASDAMPAAMGGWDQLPWDVDYGDLPNVHPRVSGTRGKALRMAREHDIPLMQIMAIASYNTAKYLGKTGVKAMDERGRMQEGMVADIAIFDPERVTDNSTYEKGLVPTTGIPFVLVHGTVVVKDSKVLPNVYPGQPIRFEPTAESKYEEVSTELWKNTYLVQPDERLHDPTSCLHGIEKTSN